MLEKLAKNHSKWLAIAYKICGCKDNANDIVQDMYIKMYELGKEVDEGYIYFVLRSIFIDSKRKQKEFTISDDSLFNYLIEEETNNEEKELLNKCLARSYNSLEKHEKVIIHFSVNMGLREFSRESGLSISLIAKTKRKLKIKIWEETKKYEELEILSNKLQKQLESKNVQVAQNEKMF